jgi:hypothetical protein
MKKLMFYPLRSLFVSCPAIMGQVLVIVHRCIVIHLIPGHNIGSISAIEAKRVNA